MKEKLREGYTTGTCAAGAALASAIWKTTGTLPEQAAVETPSGKTFILDIHPIRYGVCGVIKDGGDDIDNTNGCMVTAETIIHDHSGEAVFIGGDGVGTVTKKGLKIPVGEPAINPVPRDMIEKSVRGVIGDRAFDVIISVPNGESIAEKTFNGRLGIVGGISILGTTGIVRPMDEKALKDAIAEELSMHRAEYGTFTAVAAGYSGERFLREKYGINSAVLFSNHLGFVLDKCEEMGFKNIIAVGGCGKMLKPAADIMNLHSHIAGGQREILCTHSALCGANLNIIRRIYASNTTAECIEILKNAEIAETVFASAAEKAAENCIKRTHSKINVGVILLDGKNEMIGKSQNIDDILMTREV
ncbi:MAG: cobalt-precorrin-5B (C(1))-methyltransferase CbiD [Oscillospiraceae bacterium]|nr:cobalt-precorrin-5B (C(1))-methyltransferase CbiD [Oscillospiraceae bacterium]